MGSAHVSLGSWGLAGGGLYSGHCAGSGDFYPTLFQTSGSHMVRAIIEQCFSGLASHMATEQRVLAAGALDALIHALRRDVRFLACCCIKADGITTQKTNKKGHEQQQK